MTVPPTELFMPPEAGEPLTPPQLKDGDAEAFQGVAPAYEISTWLLALRSFFNLSNYPFSEINHAVLVSRDWSSDLRIVRSALLRSSELVFQLVNLDKPDSTIFDDIDAGGALPAFPPAPSSEAAKPELKDSALLTLSATLGDACALCQSLLASRPVSMQAWMSLGEMLDGELRSVEVAKILRQLSSQQEVLNIPPSLLALTQEAVSPAALGSDVLSVFSGLFRLLEYLRIVETFLRRDQPLKQTLLIFMLVHEGARALMEFIESRVLQTEGLEKNVHEALDSTNYAIRMELRKVFTHELVGLISLQQAPAIYVKVENAHGLLRDSFQQSVVSLARVFKPDTDDAQLFDTFRTKLEQSLTLRRDLWTLLQLVRRAEAAQSEAHLEHLRERLCGFREGSLRFLMFKDWESCERFMEEIEAARTSVELTSVLHRFSAYLETLGNQVGMRAVLVNHAFDYPKLEEA